jgi:hypothetical protein
MLPALRLVLLTLAALLVSTPAAHAAKGLSVAIPAEGQVAVAVAAGAKAVKVKSAPAGVTVAGGVKKGKLAVAVVRPRGVAATGKVAFTLRGKAKRVKTFGAALDGGKAGAVCKDLRALLSRRLKGNSDTKALSPILAAKLCGKPSPANAAAVLGRLGLGAPPPSLQGRLAPPPSSGSLRPGPGTARPAPTPTPNPVRPCDNGLDDDGDGQTDWEDPGCEHAGDPTETGEVPVSAACAAEAGLTMGEDPTEFGIGINGACGTFYSVEIDLPPGVLSCTANNGYQCDVFDPVADARVDVEDPEGDMVDVGLVLKGPVQCEKPYTIAFWRRSGEVAELRAKVANCRDLPAPPPKCANGKDDDGDGMIDSRDAAGVTDPDPGCASPADTSENSEVPSPDWCQIQVGIFGNDPRLPGLQIDGCGVIKGVWFKPPGTPVGCVFRIGGNDAQGCDVTGGTGGATFPLTNMQVLLATPLAADATCAPVTVVLVRENDEVYADRVPFC